MRKLPLVFALISAACGSAHAKRIASPPATAAVERAPYNVELVAANGQALDTYTRRGRFYVHGSQGERYGIRIENPTGRRVEAVVSVDGLDVVDGEDAKVTKRGYIVPPYGSVQIDGFRVSTEAVAAFRFSSVSRSYAGRKGKARNVGVVGVAIFEERGNAQIARPNPPRRYRVPRAGLGGGHLDSDAAEDRISESEMLSEPATTTGGAEAPPMRRPKADSRKSSIAKKRERSGLGTEFGERRNSVVQFTPFVRKNAKRPTAYTELRYNNASGLRALGILVEPEVSSQEIGLRETATPFPGQSFSKPPR